MSDEGSLFQKIDETTSTTTTENGVEFVKLNDNTRPYEMESLCMECGKFGTTRIMMVQIPNFREVIISSFSCPNCGLRNTEVSTGAEIQAKGRRYSLRVTAADDLQRQVVKADYCTVSIPELELEIPPTMLRGDLSTVEGILSNTAELLTETSKMNAEEGNTELAEQLNAFVAKLKDYIIADPKVLPFTLVVDDPSGNSFLENPFFPEADHNLIIEDYIRTADQSEAIGLDPEQDKQLTNMSSGAILQSNDADRLLSLSIKTPEEVMCMDLACPVCNRVSQQKMVCTEIPHFKEIILMAYLCNYCGYKSTEIKSGGAIAEKGRSYTLTVTDEDDLNRDVLKSDTASLNVPEIGLEVQPGILGGTFTTVEGILQKARETLRGNAPFSGDSMTEESKEKLEQWFTNFDELLSLKKEFTFILSDPAANSFIQPLEVPIENDTNLIVVDYDRTFAENEDLGLNDATF